jgi:hypothetical protein
VQHSAPVVLWTLAGFADVWRCELEDCAIGLFMGHELFLAELWPSAEDARARARALRAQLLARGWLERH